MAGGQDTVWFFFFFVWIGGLNLESFKNQPFGILSVSSVPKVWLLKRVVKERQALF